MSTINEFFIQYGYFGMFLAALLAGSLVPFSSEAVMGALLIATDMNPVMTVVAATIGNIAGSMFNYSLGRLGDLEKVSKWLKIKPKRMEKAQRWVNQRGVWVGFFCFLPILGTAIAFVLGMMRTNIWKSLIAISIGKLLRYILVASTVVALF